MYASRNGKFAVSVTIISVRCQHVCRRLTRYPRLALSIQSRRRQCMCQNAVHTIISYISMSSADLHCISH